MKARMPTPAPPLLLLAAPRLAEVHFKAVYPLQMLDRLAEAQRQCSAAATLLRGRRDQVGLRWLFEKSVVAGEKRMRPF